VDAHSSTSTDESGNDSFTCSEIEYDNNSLNGDNKYSKDSNDRRNKDKGNSSSNKPPMPPPYDGFDSSFRGSLSTLVASDDDLSTHMGGLYRQPNGASPSATTLGWDYLLNWGPNFESLMGVFKDIAELPDTVNGRVPTSLRIPTNVQNPSEEYV
jgi:protocadherin Fat 4